MRKSVSLLFLLIGILHASAATALGQGPVLEDAKGAPEIYSKERKEMTADSGAYYNDSGTGADFSFRKSVGDITGASTQTDEEISDVKIREAQMKQRLLSGDFGKLYRTGNSDADMYGVLNLFAIISILLVLHWYSNSVRKAQSEGEEKSLKPRIPVYLSAIFVVLTAILSILGEAVRSKIPMDEIWLLSVVELVAGRPEVVVKILSTAIWFPGIFGAINFITAMGVAQNTDKDAKNATPFAMGFAAMISCLAPVANTLKIVDFVWPRQAQTETVAPVQSSYQGTTPREPSPPVETNPSKDPPSASRAGLETGITD